MLLAVTCVVAQPKLSSYNGHYYEWVPVVTGSPDFTYTASLAKAALKTYTIPGTSTVLKGYLATFTSEAELQQAIFAMGNPTISEIWVSGALVAPSRNVWNYNSGPENGQLMFERSTGRCNGHCPWDQLDIARFPSIGQDCAYMTSAFILKTTTIALAEKKGYIVEYGGLDSIPTISSVSSQGGLANITGLTGYNLASLTVTVNTAACTGGQSLSTTSFSCNLPAGAGAGVAKITITDGTLTFFTNYTYTPAYIESLYPGYAVGDFITLVGDNFGTDPAAITIKTGEVSKTACTNIAFTTNHKVVTCKLGKAPSATDTLLPVIVTVNGARTVHNRMAFYDAANLQMIRVSPAYEVYSDVLIMVSTFLPLEGSTAYTSGVMKNQAAFLNKIYNFVSGTDFLYTGLQYNAAIGNRVAGFYFSHPSDPLYNQLAIMSNGTCTPLIDCNGGTFTDNKASWITGWSTIRYSPGTTMLYSGGPASGTNAIKEGEMAFYGQIPSTTPAASPIYLNSTGGQVTANVTFNGFRYSKRTFSIDGVAIVSPVTQVSTDSVSFLIPAGSGATVHTTNIVIETKALTGPTFAYYAPYLSSVSTVTSTDGGVITIEGINLAATTAATTVKVGELVCANPTIVTPHTSISCTLPQGTGANLPVVVTVDQQVQSNTLTFSFPAPVITSVTQDNLLITVVGSNLGGQSSVIVANMATAISPNSLNGNSLVFTVPSDSQNGLFSITVNGQTSNNVQLDFIPHVNTVTGSITSNGAITITGVFLTGQRLNGTTTTVSVMVGTSECTTPVASGTSITCTLGLGAGTQALSVTIDNQKSESYDITFPAPTITASLQTESSLTLTGSNFGTNKNSIIVEFIKNLPAGSVNPTDILSSPDRIIVNIPSVAKNGGIFVHAGGVASDEYIITLIPVLTSAPTIPTIGGAVTVTGVFLYDTDQSDSQLETIVELDEVAISTGVIFQGTSIVVPFPSGVGAAHELSVTIDGKNAVLAVAYTAPAITEATVSGSTLQLTGTNFGNIVEKTSTTPSLTITTVNHTLITAAVPTANGPINVTVDGQTSNSVDVVLTPSVISAVAISAEGGLVTITGTNLMLTHTDGSTATSTITFGEATCTAPTSPSTTQLICTLPAGQLDGVPIIVKIDGVSSNTDIYYTSSTATTTTASTTTTTTTTTTSATTTTTTTATSTTGTPSSTSTTTTSPSTSTTGTPSTSVNTADSTTTSFNSGSSLQSSVTMIVLLIVGLISL
eukprot:gene1495-1736_t